MCVTSILLSNIEKTILALSRNRPPTFSCDYIISSEGFQICLALIYESQKSYDNRLESFVRDYHCIEVAMSVKLVEIEAVTNLQFLELLQAMKTLSLSLPLAPFLPLSLSSGEISGKICRFRC